MALAGAVFATEPEEVLLLSTDIKKDLTFDGVNSAVGLTVSEATLQGWDLSGNPIANFASMSGGNQQADYLRPNVNVGSGGAWTLSFSLTNNGDQALTLTSCDLDMIMFNSDGDNQTNQVTRAISYTLTAIRNDQSVVTLYSNNSVTMQGVGVGTVDVNPDFTSSYELAAGEKITFTLAIADGTTTDSEHAKGTYIGIKNIAFSGQVIPEPTTATLSLLALAGLATRRRRK